MQVVVWILLILLVIFLIWLLRRWIKRLIFILILLVLAFFIYGIFSPSGAARLWYNVRTFPQRVAMWMGSGEELLDYDSYKSKISAIGDEIGEKINLDVDIPDVEITDDENEDEDNIEIDEKIDENSEEKSGEATEIKHGQTIKSFPDSTKFIDFPQIKDDAEVENKTEEKTENYEAMTGYSKSDLIGIINTYLEKNLDDDTDILVTVEYQDDNVDPDKIILQTQSRID